MAAKLSKLSSIAASAAIATILTGCVQSAPPPAQEGVGASYTVEELMKDKKTREEVLEGCKKNNQLLGDCRVAQEAINTIANRKEIKKQILDSDPNTKMPDEWYEWEE